MNHFCNERALQTLLLVVQDLVVQIPCLQSNVQSICAVAVIRFHGYFDVASPKTEQQVSFLQLQKQVIHGEFSLLQTRRGRSDHCYNYHAFYKFTYLSPKLEFFMQKKKILHSCHFQETTFYAHGHNCHSPWHSVSGIVVVLAQAFYTPKRYCQLQLFFPWQDFYLAEKIQEQQETAVIFQEDIGYGT